MRVWDSQALDNGSIHCMGNGKLCAYGQGPDLIQVFGPPYSSPTLFKFLIGREQSIESHSSREPETAIWTHQLFSAVQEVGKIVDFVDSGLACLVRSIFTSVPLRFHLALSDRVRLIDNGARIDPKNGGGWLLEAPAGTFLYHTYPFPMPLFHQVAWKGPVLAQAGSAGGEFVCGPGEVFFWFSGGPDYASAMLTSQAVREASHSHLLSQTRASWHEFSSSRHPFSDELPLNLPLRASLLQSLDDVAVMIKTQQSEQGAVIAGHNYHMGYVRDQYGVSRLLLAMGLITEARHILEFYWCVFQRHGRIHNAQACGVDGVFHVHENDEVEITGYLIRQAFDLLAHSGDEEFMHLIFPMLQWAWEAQKVHLAQGMLPFNGDETYVAGGVLPRYTLNDGSAEATLLFIDGGERLLAWIEKNQSWQPDRLADNRRVLESSCVVYRKNFWLEGKLLTNQPERTPERGLPRFRHGVCERCALEGRHQGIEWTERSEVGRYLCPNCLSQGAFEPAPVSFFFLQSVGLSPFYFQSSLFEPAELAPAVSAILQNYLATGVLPSRPDDATSLTVGYDYGLLLYALTELGSPEGAILYEKTLSLVDETGAWVEYYLDHKPQGTRCRPWESAINLEALLHWAIRFTTN